MRMLANCIFAVLLAFICNGTKFGYFHDDGSFSIGGMLAQWGILFVFNILTALIEDKGGRAR